MKIFNGTIIVLTSAVLFMGLAEAKPQKFQVPTAGSGCFDFENLPAEERYEVGDVVETQYGPVNLVNYTLNRTTPNPDNPDVIRAQVNSSSIAGEGPEVLFYLINAAFVPDQGLQQITFDFAESWANGEPQGAHSNLGINGMRVEVPRSLRSINGRQIGRPRIGKAEVSVEIAEPSEGSNWATGRVTINAVNGSTIKRFVIGGRQVIVDNVCFS